MAFAQNPSACHRGGKPIRSPYQGWRTACKKAGVPGRLIHDLRRTAIRRVERAGVPRSVAMKLSGHLTESVYRRYAIVSEVDLAEGVRKIAALTGVIGARARLAAGVGEAESAAE